MQSGCEPILRECLAVPLIAQLFPELVVELLSAVMSNCRAGYGWVCAWWPVIVPAVDELQIVLALWLLACAAVWYRSSHHPLVAWLREIDFF